jgi:predicted acylesterase/phospholipase RssA
VLDRGLVWRAVRASISLPSVFPPVLMGKEMLVDGGVINNLPSDILKERIEGGIVLASDLTAQEPETYEYEEDLTSWKMLWARVNPMIKTKQIPSIAKVVSETMNLASKWQRPRQSASIDVLIRVPADQYNMFDYDAHEALVELGYRTAIEALEAWER